MQSLTFPQNFCFLGTDYSAVANSMVAVAITGILTALSGPNILTCPVDTKIAVSKLSSIPHIVINLGHMCITGNEVFSYLFLNYCWLSSVQFSSVAQSCPTLCNPMNRSAPGLPVHHQLPEFTQTHVHRVSDAIQPSHPLSSPSLPALNPSQHQGLFQWINSSHELAKVLEFQL